MNSSRHTWRDKALLALLIVAAAGNVLAEADGGNESRTVIGPRNPDLHDGAQALLAGNIEKGIELTLDGLEFAQGRRERQAAMSNLCAGYNMLAQYETALTWCNRALEENPRNWRALNNRALVYLYLKRYDESKADLDLGQEIAPNAKTLKEARGLLRDAVDPVTPNIVIDDRRDAPDDEDL